MSTYALVEHVLALRVDDRAEGAIRQWIPRNAVVVADETAFGSRIVVLSGDAGVVRGPQGDIDTGVKPTLTLDGVGLWVHGDAGVMRGSDPDTAMGTLDLARGVATVRVPASRDAHSQDAYSMLTIAAALLLLRRQCALVHAGAVLVADGDAWLLVGDTHSGKSTTCLNLLRGGCQYLADDQVVLQQDGEHVVVHGWPREFHLDEGWSRGERIGRRTGIDPHEYSSARPRTARAAGLLLLSIDSSQASRVSRASSGEVLAALVRQTPWFLADRALAAPGLALLAGVAKLPAYELRAGLDVYTDAARLMELVSPAFRSGEAAITAG